MTGKSSSQAGDGFWQSAHKEHEKWAVVDLDPGLQDGRTSECDMIFLIQCALGTTKATPDGMQLSAQCDRKA